MWAIVAVATEHATLSLVRDAGSIIVLAVALTLAGFLPRGFLTGGGALLRGLDKRLSMKTKLPVHVAEDPLRAVVRGTGIALKNLDNFKAVLMT